MKIHDLNYSDIAKQIRKDLKEEFKKDFKFSVQTNTYAGWWSIDLYILKWNIDFYTPEYTRAFILYWDTCLQRYRDEMDSLYSERYTREGKNAIAKVERIHNQYNHNNSDSMTDYYDVNYAWQVKIWKWDHEYIKI